MTNPFKEVINLFSALRYFYDKLPQKGELDDFIYQKEYLESLKHFHSAGMHLYYVADLRKTQIVDAGGNLKQLVGIQKEDIINRNFAYGLRFFPISSLPGILRVMIDYHEYVYKKEIQHRIKIKGTIVLRVKKENGGYFIGLLQAVPLALDSHGHIAYMYTSITDVTHLNLVAHELQANIIDESDPDEVKFINIINKEPDITIKLSKSELKVLKLLAEGMNAKQIADSLFISEHTVKTHRKNMIQKANVKNTAELISCTSKFIS
jgi:DNA-binding CsgD family transcriptional regulator